MIKITFCSFLTRKKKKKKKNVCDLCKILYKFLVYSSLMLFQNCIFFVFFLFFDKRKLSIQFKLTSKTKHNAFFLYRISALKMTKRNKCAFENNKERKRKKKRRRNNKNGIRNETILKWKKAKYIL